MKKRCFGPADHLWPARFGATAFSCVILQDWWKNCIQLDKEKKTLSSYPNFILSIFKIIQLSNPNFFPYLNPMKYRETQMTVWSYNHNCQLFNSDLLSVINHPVPTFDLTFNQLCPITHLSPKTKTFLMVLLSSPAVITTRTAFCNMTLSGHPSRWRWPHRFGSGQPAETWFPTFASLYTWLHSKGEFQTVK